MMISDTIKEVKTQAKSSASQVTRRVDLLNKKSELKKLYEALGKVQYQIYVSNEENIERDILYSKIDKLKSDIDALQMQVQDIVDTQKMSFNQYKHNVKHHKETQKEVHDAFDTAEILKICPVCNTGNYEHAAFCINCGNKFDE